MYNILCMYVRHSRAPLHQPHTNVCNVHARMWDHMAMVSQYICTYLYSTPRLLQPLDWQWSKVREGSKEDESPKLPSRGDRARHAVQTVQQWDLIQQRRHIRQEAESPQQRGYSYYNLNAWPSHRSQCSHRDREAKTDRLQKKSLLFVAIRVFRCYQLIHMHTCVSSGSPQTRPCMSLVNISYHEWYQSKAQVV